MTCLQVRVHLSVHLWLTVVETENPTESNAYKIQCGCKQYTSNNKKKNFQWNEPHEHLSFHLCFLSILVIHISTLFQISRICSKRLWIVCALRILQPIQLFEKKISHALKSMMNFLTFKQSRGSVLFTVVLCAVVPVMTTFEWFYWSVYKQFGIKFT